MYLLASKLNSRHASNPSKARKYLHTTADYTSSNKTTDGDTGLSADTFPTFSDIFEVYGLLDGEVHLEVDKTITAVCLSLRKLPVPIKDKVATLSLIGICRMKASSHLHANQHHWSQCICIDPKPLNKALLRDHYPTPTRPTTLHSPSVATSSWPRSHRPAQKSTHISETSQSNQLL